MSLTQQTLILIAIPFVFQLIFVFVLTDKIQQLERQYAIEAHFTRIMTVANSIFVSVIGLSGAETIYRATQQPQFKISFESGLQLLAKKRKELGELVAHDTGNDLTLRNMLRVVDQAIAVLAEARTSFENDDELGIKMAYVKISQFVPKLLKMNDSLLANQQRTNQQNLEAQRKAQTDVLVTVYGGLVANLLLVASMMLYFKETTSRRFKVLSNNIIAVGREESLKERLSRGDEISSLDEVVHQVAATLEEARRKRAEAEAAKGQIVAMVTHDLRSPLTSLALALNMLKSGDIDRTSDRATATLGRAEKSVAQLVALINDLLDVDRIESGMLSLERSNCRDEELVTEAIELIDYMGQSRTITLESKCAGLELSCDKGRIVRVLTNLLVNAIKFSPANSTVTVSSRVVTNQDGAGKGFSNSARGADGASSGMGEPSGGTSSGAAGSSGAVSSGLKERSGGTSSGSVEGPPVSGSSRGDWIEFRVTDHGDGIPESERKRIFDKYAQVDPGGLIEKQGSGLGLAICKSFIDVHGGTIGVDSTTGDNSGSSFWFRIPAR